MTKKELSFEQALEELQTIVNDLEAGNAGLDNALELYGRGVELIRFCNARLEEAEQKIGMIKTGADGTVTVAPFVGEAEV